jgi:lipoate-protein ligase B
LNIDVDLAYFHNIHPCGLESSVVTRLTDHVSPCPRLSEIRDAMGSEFRQWWREWCALV